MKELEVLLDKLERNGCSTAGTVQRDYRAVVRSAEIFAVHLLSLCKLDVCAAFVTSKRIERSEE